MSDSAATRFNYKISEKSGRYQYSIDKIAEIEAPVGGPSAEEPSIPEFAKLLEDFVVQVTTSANVHAFVITITASHADEIIQSDIIPHVQALGTATTPKDGYTDAYSINDSILAEQSSAFAEIHRSQKAKEAMGPLILLNLTAHYDVLIAGIIKAYLSKHPEIIDKSEKTFTLSELKRFSSIDDAQRHLIDREVDSIMYGSHKSQIEWLEKISKKKIFELLPEIPDFCEMFERRNLCAHNNNIVNDKYLSNCAKFGIKIEKLPKENSKLFVGTVYLNKITPILIEYGILITQSVWRSLSRSNDDEIEAADDLLLMQADYLIANEKFELAERVLHTGYTKFRPFNDLNKRHMILKRAETFLLMEKHDRAISTIKDHDWSSSNPTIRLRAYAILQEHDEAIRLMRAVDVDHSITKDEYSNSVAFQTLISQEGFQSEFRKIYGHDFSKHSPNSVSAETSEDGTMASDETQQGDAQGTVNA